jgi:protein-S-isoprenylcysteine O-methyltransferase Ste14
MLSGAGIIKSPPLLIIELSGLITGFWSVFAMKIRNFNISPEVKTGGKMTSRGPYKIIRHPMYLSILLFFMNCLA